LAFPRKPIHGAKISSNPPCTQAGPLCVTATPKGRTSEAVHALPRWYIHSCTVTILHHSRTYRGCVPYGPACVFHVTWRVCCIWHGGRVAYGWKWTQYATLQLVTRITISQATSARFEPQSRGNKPYSFNGIFVGAVTALHSENRIFLFAEVQYAGLMSNEWFSGPLPHIKIVPVSIHSTNQGCVVGGILLGYHLGTITEHSQVRIVNREKLKVIYRLESRKKHRRHLNFMARKMRQLLKVIHV